MIEEPCQSRTRVSRPIYTNVAGTQVSIAYGYMYILFTTLTPVFERTYDFSQGAAGLSFLGLSKSI